MDETFESIHRGSNRLLTGVLLAVAAPCLLGAAWMGARTLESMLLHERAQGTIVAIEDTALVVEFDAGEAAPRRVTSAGSDLNANYAVGDRLAVWYEPGRAHAARLDLVVDTWLLPALLGGFGLFWALPLVFVRELRPFAGAGGSRPLASGGTRIEATLADVEPRLEPARIPRGAGELELAHEGGRWTLTHNGRARDLADPRTARELGLAFVVHARWRDPRTGVEHAFRSPPQAENPERSLRGRTVPVWIDPANPARYRFDFAPHAGTRPTPTNPPRADR